MQLFPSHGEHSQRVGDALVVPKDGCGVSEPVLFVDRIRILPIDAGTMLAREAARGHGLRHHPPTDPAQFASSRLYLSPTSAPLRGPHYSVTNRDNEPAESQT